MRRGDAAAGGCGTAPPFVTPGALDEGAEA